MASGSSASGPSGVVVMTATLPTGYRSASCRRNSTYADGVAGHDADSFPRANARTQTVHPRCATVAPARPDGAPAAVPALAGTARTRSASLWSLDVATGTETPGRRPARAAGAAATRSCPAPSGPAASAAARARRASSATPPTATPRSRRSPCPAGCGSPTWPDPQRRPRAAGGRRGHRPAPRPDRHAGSPTRPTAACTSCASTAARRATLGDRREDATSPGAWPSSWPPRRWAATAATGGPRTAARCSPRGSTRARCSGGTSPTRPTRRRRPTEVRYPVAGSADAEVTLHLLGLDGGRADVHVGPRRPSRTSSRRLVVGRPARSCR